jgi:hypothetical protein
MHRTFGLALIAMLVVACGGGPPSGYSAAACEAYGAVFEASEDWRVVGQALQVGDAGTVDAGLAEIEDKAVTAVDLVSDLPDWDPGERLVQSTYQAAADYITAVELYRSGDAAAGTRALDSGDRGLQSATAELVRAEDAGLSC